MTATVPAAHAFAFLKLSDYIRPAETQKINTAKSPEQAVELTDARAKELHFSPIFRFL